MDSIEQQGEGEKPRVERRPRVRRNVTASIAQDICCDRYPAGLPLPRENDLCEIYCVSRTVVRESLKILESKGLVRGKPRIGTTVCDKDDWNILDADVLEWMGPHLEDSDLLGCIIEARRTIEPAAAEYAAARARRRRLPISTAPGDRCAIAPTIRKASPMPTSCSIRRC
ncbi:DNA-binding FadR family transcriptional regulator [Rhizobium mongolense]|uniref:DNA-binding FadR family transcriptional regulator n=1 Tax=Rhizobium mongolense TaxID=57676 RepID=A0ABR6ITZ2_9HYPH|nr:DNA-binding FadR family transcriptional regulator [Rhizobium mongolense]